MRREWEPEELIACWTLVDDDWRLVTRTRARGQHVESWTLFVCLSCINPVCRTGALTLPGQRSSRLLLACVERHWRAVPLVTDLVPAG